MIQKEIKKNFSKVKRDLKKEGNFFQASNSILFDTNLTDSAKILFFALSSSKFSVIRLTYYRKKFGWCKDKLASTVKNLEDNGYFKKKKNPEGQKKGFEYFYTISEFGNLSTNTNNNINEKAREDFEKVVFKYQHLFKHNWFECLVKESNGDSEIFEDSLKVFLKINCENLS